MAILKAKQAVEPFKVPSLAEADPTYNALLERQAALASESNDLAHEQRRLEKEIAAAPDRALPDRVAALLGDPSDGVSAKRARLREVTARHRDVEAALSVLRTRISDARSRASVAVCEAVRPEYARRVGAICKALEAAAEAREELHKLIDALERADVAWLRLGSMVPAFLGDRRDGRVPQYLREAKEAGYHA